MDEMGMPNSTYLPNLDKLLYRIAPTEYSRKSTDNSASRRGLIRGHVHDPTSYLFGGVAGHAGLFSVAEDLETYMQIHLNKGVHRNGTRVYQERTVEQFYTREDGLPYNNRRALGWDTVPIQTNPPCGKLFSLNSFGHTGYTGTMMWADRDKKIIVVLLTHRVHPTSESLLITEGRARIVDEIVMTLAV
jgi:CubicO group peptidase (beta-lactamase class C family)